MKNVSTRKKVKVIGHKRLMDTDGTFFDMQVMEVEEKDANFHKIWLGHIIQALDMIGNQKIRLVNFILENLDKENKLVMTQRKIAEKSDISFGTVISTMKLLQEANFIVKINSGAYQVNPEIVFKGGTGARMNVLIQYKQAGQEAAATTTKKAQEGPTLDDLEQQGQEVLFDAQRVTEEVTATVPKDTCRICGAELIERTRRDDGKKFLGCPNWKKPNHNVARGA